MLAVLFLGVGTAGLAVIDWVLLPHYLAARAQPVSSVPVAPPLDLVPTAVVAPRPAVAAARPTPTSAIPVSPTLLPTLLPTPTPAPAPSPAAQALEPPAGVEAAHVAANEVPPAAPSPAGEASAPSARSALPEPLPNLLFASNTAWLSPASRQTLQALLRSLAEHPELQVVLKGHTDGQGDPDLNLALGRERATRAAKWLEAHGVNSERIEIHSFGSRQPLTDDPSPEGRARNRRVEIELK